MLVGQLGHSLHLEPGEQRAIEFIVTWHFANFRGQRSGQRAGRPFVRSSFRLGYWLSPVTLSRPTLTGSPATLASGSRPGTTRRCRTGCSTVQWPTRRRWRRRLATAFEDGRFWAWEGIGCCYGTCTHVWHYAQAPGRLFPEIERIERERVNFGIGQHADGGIGMRTKLTGSNEHADDGHCGRVLGVLREHQMSTDDAFLRRLWPNVKKAVQFMIRRDGNADGLLEGAQPNTLDANWYGKISFISSLYLAMLKASEAMATEMGDEQFAGQCREIAKRGQKSIQQTFNGEYFVQIEDPDHKDKIGVGSGCYIDQVFGQTGRTGSVWADCSIATSNSRPCGRCGNTTSFRMSALSGNDSYRGGGMPLRATPV